MEDSIDVTIAMTEMKADPQEVAVTVEDHLEAKVASTEITIAITTETTADPQEVVVMASKETILDL